MKREFILLISIHGKQTEFPFSIEDDKVSVYNAFLTKELEIEKTGIENIDLFTVFNGSKDQLFTEEIYDDEDRTFYICRWCGELIEVGNGVFIENDSECHCEACHPLLFNTNEWATLYNEHNDNVGDGDNVFGGDSYYWTIVSE